MSKSNPVQQDKNNDIPVEIHGYVTDPKLVGFQILTNYESTYWRTLVGNEAWGLFEVLRSFCHEGNDTCNPSISLLTDILSVSDRRHITGRVQVKDGKEYNSPGLIDVLQEYGLAVAEEVGHGPSLRYVFHVNLTPGALAAEQIAKLPKRLRKKHDKLIKRVARDQVKLDDRVERKKKRKKGKRQRSGAAKKAEGGYGESPEGYGESPEGYGESPDRTTPNNNTHKQQQKREKENNNSSGQPDTKQDVVVALTDLGISTKVAKRLADRYSRDRVFEKIEFLEYLQETDPEKVKNPRGWLRRAIEENYGPPGGYKTKEEREAEEAEKKRKREELARLEAEEEKSRQEEEKRARQEYAQWLARMQEQYGTTEREIELWPRALSELELQIPRATYQAWFPQTQLLSLTDGEALIAVPNTATKEWLEHRLADKIKGTLEGLEHPVERLKFEVIKTEPGTDEDTSP